MTTTQNTENTYYTHKILTRTLWTFHPGQAPISPRTSIGQDATERITAIRNIKIISTLISTLISTST